MDPTQIHVGGTNMITLSRNNSPTLLRTTVFIVSALFERSPTRCVPVLWYNDPLVPCRLMKLQPGGARRAVGSQSRMTNRKTFKKLPHPLQNNAVRSKIEIYLGGCNHTPQCLFIERENTYDDRFLPRRTVNHPTPPPQSRAKYPSKPPRSV